MDGGLATAIQPPRRRVPPSVSIMSAGSVAAKALLLAGLAGLGTTGLLSGAALPQLQPLPAGQELSSSTAMANGLVLILASLAVFRSLRRLGWLLCLYWTVWLVGGHFMAWLTGPITALSWVPAVETLAFAAVGVFLARPASRNILRAVCGAMLLLFGVVHLTHREMISGLIPDYLPGAMVWPWLTGAAQLAAGLALWTQRARVPGAAAVAIMYLTWIVLLHVPRVADNPTDPFEWSFVLTAACLAATVWLAGSPSPSSADAASPTARKDR